MLSNYTKKNKKKKTKKKKKTSRNLGEFNEVGKPNVQNDGEAWKCQVFGRLWAILHTGKLEWKGRDPKEDPKILG